MRRVSAMAVRAIPDPTVTRATPSSCRRRTDGDPAIARKFSGKCKASTKRRMVSSSNTPGMNTQSAPAARVGQSPFAGALETRGRISDIGEIKISAGVDHDVDSQLKPNPPGRSNDLCMLGCLPAPVFQIETNGTGFNQPGNRCGDVSIATLEIGGNGNRHTSGNTLDDCQHFLCGDALSVRVTHRESNAGTGGGNCGESGFLENTGACAIPGVRQKQKIGTMVKHAECFRFLSYCWHATILLASAFIRGRSGWFAKM